MSRLIYKHHEIKNNNNNLSLEEELLKEADKLQRRADNFKGCSFVGKWPGSYYLKQANLLTIAALEIIKNKKSK